MSFGDRILLRMFGRPTGVLGRIGGLILARFNRGFAEEIVTLLDVHAAERVLEVGFGPGVAIELLAGAASVGKVVGIDPSKEMVEQASARNAAAIGTGTVDLRQGSVASMPFEDDSFDTALAINSMQVWPDKPAGLREIRRVLTGGGRLALGFTPNSRQPKAGVAELLSAAGFEAARLVDLRGGFCALAQKASMREAAAAANPLPRG
jgi:ubiquinone/menaquinone biosynthesis C-methylase UbiE